MRKLKYSSDWLQEQANELGSWNKVCQKYGISSRTIDKYKKKQLIDSVIKKNVICDIDLDRIQSLYDSGMSIRSIARHFNIPHSYFFSKIITRSRSDANRICKRSVSEEARAKLSKLAKERNLGGYRPHPNRGQRYKNIWFDSKWEVCVAKSLDKHDIEWSRPNIGFVWSDDGKKYYPDFFLPKYNIYLDPKNEYLIKLHAKKINEAQARNDIIVIVLASNELEWSVIETKIQSLLSSVIE